MINKELFGPALRQNTLMAALALLIVGSALLILLNQPAEAQANTRATSNLSLSSTSPGELVITWDAPSDAPDDYRVTWKKSGGKWPSYKNENTAQGGNAFPSGTSHTVSDLEAGTEYSVRVRARYFDGNDNLTESGPWSDPPAELTIAALPDKPMGLSTSPSHDSVLLAWTDPGDSSITGYQVLHGPDTDNLAVLTADTGSATTSYTDDTVEAETTYVYAIRARNVHGLGPQSDAVPAVTTAAPAPPAKPTGLSTNPSHDSVVLSWTDPGDSITSYQILRGPDADNLAVLADNTGDATTSYTDDSVTAETTYAYAIKARNTDGLSPQSDTVSVTTPEAPAPPAKPTGLSTTPSHDSVLLVWTDPGDSTITGYQILRGPDADNLAALNEDAGSSSSASYTDDTVDAEATYAYAIKARNSAGRGPQSDPVTVTTPAAPEEAPVAEQLPSASFTLDGKALDTSGTCSEDDIGAVADACTINITTKSPVFAVHGTVDSDDRISIRTGRDITAALAASEIAGESELRGTDQTVTLTLAEGRHLLRVWEDEDGDSGGEQARFFRINVLPYWELDSQQLSKDSTCQSTTDRALADITDSDCIVTQSGNTGSLRFHNVTREQFNVYVSVNGSEIIREPDDDALGGPFTAELQSGDNLLRVRLASKGNTHGAESYSSNAFYYKITTPSPPAKPRITGVGGTHSSAQLDWADPNDDSITGYRILRGDAADSLTVLVEDTVSTDTRYTDDTVEPETEYFYAIRARNAQGLGPQSDTVSVRTQPAPPEPVEPVADMATAAGAPTISGTPMVGQTLTADTSGITDADGLTTPRWTYQWVRVNADLTENDISGATSQTYELVTDDVGNKIKVVVSFTDDASESESRPSEPFPEHKFVLEQSELVSNRDQGSRTHIGNGLSAIKAQGFRTGPHPHGYDISTAVLRFAGGNLPASRFSLTIYSSNAGGNAGDELYEFVDPSTISTGFQTFTAPEGFHLEPNTDYFLRLWGDGSSSLFPSLADTTKEDSDSAHGWTIADSHQSAIGESIFWSLINTRLVMELFGSETSGPGPAAESLTVTSTPTNPTNYLTGDTITFALRFDESAMASGDPELEFDIGGTKRRAAYDSAASSGGTVVFSYTVVSDDQDRDGIDTGFIADAIKLDTDDSIQDADSNTATYGSVKLSRQADHRVNAAPGIASIEVTSTPVAPRYYGPSEDINITVTFDTPVTVTGNPEFEFSLGNSGETRNVRAQYNADLSTTTDVVFTYTVLPTDEDSNGIFLHDGTNSFKLDTDDSIQDANNKDAILTFRELSTQENHKIDPRPRAASVEVTSTPTAGTDTYGAGEIIEFTVTFNQPVIVTGEPHYVFSLGNSGDTRDLTATYDAGRSSARALVFTYTVVSTDVDNNGIYLYAGNTSFVLETGETVRNKFGNDARTDYGGNVGQGDHKVDGSQTPTNTPPGGLPTISGTAEVGQTLTASTTGITDDDGLATPGWTYQWIHVDTEGTETDIPSATSQTYTLVSTDADLQFRIRVTFTDDGSASETLRSAIFPSSRAPSAPETLSLSNDRGDVTLDWTPPTDTGSSPITRYQYRVSDDGGNTWSPDFTDVPDQNSDGDQADERSYTISSLTLGTEHTIEVRAHNATRPGALASRTITPATTPRRPQSVNATAGDQQVALTWSAPSSDGGSPITHYQYRVRDETDNVWLPGFATGLLTVPDSDADMDLSDELSIIVTGLTNGHVYKFSVRAHNDQGGGGVADATTVPFAPLELIVHPVATDSVINIEEKGRGFNITGQTAEVEGVAITVVIGASGNLTGTSDSGGSWLVAVPPNASYIAEGALDMTVSATASGYEAPDVTRQVTVDLTKPTVQTATVNGVAITLTYSEPLRPTYIPPRTAYQVNVDGAPAPLATSNPVTISGSAVIITLAAAVSSTATVTLDYTVPTGIGERPIQDQSRNPADGFTGQPVTVITSVIIDTPTLETGEDGTTDTFNVKLAGTPSANVSIALASSDTSEGTVSPTPLTFTSTNWDTDQTVTVTGVDDTDQDGDQSYEITFAVTSTDTDYNGITVPPVKVTNIDDEASNDATLSGLALTDASNNAITLDPTFASGVDSYTATVANAVSQIKVEPTKNDDNATILYLDSDDMALADADGSTVDVFDVDLAEGENVFKVKVTAEDTTTTKTYVVTVTRDVVKVLVSNFSATDTTFSTAGMSGTTDWTGAQAFTTGENAGGYLLSSVKLLLRAVGTDTVPNIRIHNDEQGRPGTLVAGLVNPSPLPQTIVPSEYIFNAPPDTVLASRTT